MVKIKFKYKIDDEVFIMLKNEPSKRKITGVHFDNTVKEPYYNISGFITNTFKESDVYKSPKELLVKLNEKMK